MTREEMQILRDMMREEIGTALQPVNDRLERLEAGQKSLEAGQKSLEAGQKRLEAGQKSLEARQESLEAGQKSLEAGQKSLEARQESLEARQESLEAVVRHTRVLLEKQEHNISLIAEQYGDVAKKLERVREIDDLRDRVQTLETVARRHSAKLRELDKAE